MKHSGLGIASFAISIFVVIAMFGLFVVAGIMEASTPGGMSEDSTAAVVIGLGIFAIGGLGLISFGLGVATLFQRERKKLFGILGGIFSLGILLLAVGAIILGTMMG